jgi:hypothetical protein
VTGVRVGLWAILFSLPAVLLVATGLRHLRDGMALNAAFPVPLNLSLNNALPGAAYADAAIALGRADPENGAARIALAEALTHRPGNRQMIEDGLVHAPASAEGWTYYAETLAATAPEQAGLALAQAFDLAPYDSYWIGRRVQLAARLWGTLDQDTRNMALRQSRTMWDEKALREQIVPLFQTREGRDLMMQAYANDPRTITAIAQWMVTRQVQIKAGIR